jgi:hypothetical protein
MMVDVGIEWVITMFHTFRVILEQIQNVVNVPEKLKNSRSRTWAALTQTHLLLA